MSAWNPWRGCHNCSTGCKHCYIHKGDAKRGIDTNQVIKTRHFAASIEKNRNGAYKIKHSQLVYLCFSSDFLLEDADPWRPECWAMIKERSDLNFLFLTKRIERFLACVPADWNDGYDHVTVGCTIENQQNADLRLPLFAQLPIKHKIIVCQPLIGDIDLEPYLDGVELVVVGGESDRQARPLDYDWVLHIRQQCLNQGVSFEFRQLGTHFVKDGKLYTIPTRLLCAQAKKANINC
ncbi:DUF5131 family protein [Erysipelotrichaceae bacterium RD49]|nr:DUF5131 family protein [Erysipelotrichaceae bacterium RD49]